MKKHTPDPTFTIDGDVITVPRGTKYVAPVYSMARGIEFSFIPGYNEIMSAFYVAADKFRMEIRPVDVLIAMAGFIEHTIIKQENKYSVVVCNTEYNFSIEYDVISMEVTVKKITKPVEGSHVQA